MKKTQKFLSIFAVVIIVLSIIMVAKNIENYNYAKESFDKTITFSKIPIEEAQYGEVLQATRNSKYYEEIVSTINTETKLLNEIFEETGLEGVIYQHIGESYQLESEGAFKDIDYNTGRILSMSMFIAIMIFFVTEAKSDKMKKYLLINFLMILITCAFGILITFLSPNMVLYENWYDIFIQEENPIMSLGIIYLLALVTNIKLNMGKSLKINIIYAVFACLTGSIIYIITTIGNWTLPIYLLLAMIDLAYNYIKIKSNKK